MDKIAALVRVARQVEGEFILIDVIQSSDDPKDLQRYLNNTELPQTMEKDGIGYVITYGIHNDIPFSLSEQNQ